MIEELLELLGSIDWTDVEPDELRDLCASPVFQLACKYCRERRHHHPDDDDDETLAARLWETLFPRSP